jgi:hypothetical protein
MLFKIFLYIFEITASSAEIPFKVNHSLFKCTPKCACNNFQNFESCLSIKKDTISFIVKGKPNTPEVCMECYKMANIINDINDYIVKTTEVYFRDKTRLKLIEVQEGMFLGIVSENKFYIISEEINNENGNELSFFRKYKFNEFDGKDNTRFFNICGSLYKLPSFEMYNFIFYKLHNQHFIIDEVVVKKENVIEEVEKIVNYSKALYYISILLFISWLVLTCIKNKEVFVILVEYSKRKISRR